MVELKDKMVKMDLAGHYSNLGTSLEKKSGSKIQVISPFWI